MTNDNFDTKVSCEEIWGDADFQGADDIELEGVEFYTPSVTDNDDDLSF